jgi:ATP-dependent exoDNAse (exonuclease V) beta subunit
MMEKEGQFINGIADLVIETDKEVLLIDYKTFTGDDAALRYKAQTFSGQLRIYEEVLSKYFSDKEIKMAIYFIMVGRLVWMQPGRKVQSSV